ncbi:GerMN domain-containing protein [Abyssisolibacter fermentans]|uniref:GerMN domain-containing protein n=1 Tax=Abyssisolibacter fermentans TaxID=1766203 RepID=UPI0008379B11|nr:GerMN domain-containing protein [Abyssisolibacter fermentans]
MRRKILFLIFIVTFLLSGCNNKYNVKENVQLPIIEPYTSDLRSNINLYFVDKDMSKLAIEKRTFKGEMTSIKNVLVNQLFTGPKSSEYINIIPSDLKILSVIEKDHVIYINLSKDIDKIDVDEKEEALILYSLINTVSNYSKIDNVQIFIEGKRRNKFINYYKIDEPLLYSNSILENYQSPITVIEKYFNSILNKKYLHAIRMRYKYVNNDIRKNDLIFDLESQFENITEINIKSYNIDKYDNEINLYMKIEMYNNKYKRYEEYNYKSNLIRYKNSFLINEIVKI